MDWFLRLRFLHSHEGVALVEVSVDGDTAPSHFFSVIGGCAIYISFLSVEEGFNSGS